MKNQKGGERQLNINRINCKMFSSLTEPDCIDRQNNETENRVRFRERDKKKEIQPEMKYTAKSDMERLKFYLKETV